MIATERLYRTVDNRVVREGDPAAAFLLCIPGEEIPAGFDAPVDLAEAPQDPPAGEDTDATDETDPTGDEAGEEKPEPEAAEKPAPKATRKKRTAAKRKS